MQLGFCFAEGMYDRYRTALPADTNIAWSASESNVCFSSKAGTSTPYTTGFVAAFDTARPSVEQAHENAASARDPRAAGPGWQDGDPMTPTQP